MSYTTDLEIFGHTLEVEYMAWPGYPGTREDPPEPPEIEIHEINGEGADMLWAIAEKYQDVMTDIYDALEKHLENE